MFPLMSKWEQICLTFMELSPYISKLTKSTGHCFKAQHRHSFLERIRLTSSQKRERFAKLHFGFKISERNACREGYEAKWENFLNTQWTPYPQQGRGLVAYVVENPDTYPIWAFLKVLKSVGERENPSLILCFNLSLSQAGHKMQQWL